MIRYFVLLIWLTSEISIFYYFPKNFFCSFFEKSPKTQGLNGVFLGILNDESWKFGSFGFALQNNLFLSNVNGVPHVLDLLAYNINRGREQYIYLFKGYMYHTAKKSFFSFKWSTAICCIFKEMFETDRFEQFCRFVEWKFGEWI